MVRRAVALGAGVLVLILLVLGINGCLSSRAKNALRDYNRNVTAVVQDSNTQVSRQLFDLLGSGGGSAISLQQNVNQIRITANDDVKRAKAISTPGDMKAAQEHLLLALTLRAEGVGQIADNVDDLAGDKKRAAVTLIAGAMRGFLASDVVFSQRVIPYIQETLDDHGVTGQQIAASQFLPDDSWLSTNTLGDRLGVAGADTATGNAAVRPGTHGHGLTSVKVGDVTLQPGGTPNRVQASATTAFTVAFANQGENDEFDVKVRIQITGSGKPITVTKRVDETKAGSPAETQIRLGQAPPIGAFVRVKVTILAVPGEKKTDNNSQIYTVQFSR